MKKIINKIKEIYIIDKFCIQLSWNASRVYTILRILAQGMIPILLLIQSYSFKWIIDLLGIDNDKEITIIFGSVGIYFLASVIKDTVVKFDEGINEIHSEYIKKNLEENIVCNAVSIEMEKYDDPNYYNDMEMVKLHIGVLPMVIMNKIYLLKAVFSLVVSVLVLGGFNKKYIVGVLISIIPVVVLRISCSKNVISFLNEQIQINRKLGYIFHVATNKMFAMEMRLYNLRKWLIEKYENLYRKRFIIVKEISRKRISKHCAIEWISYGVKCLIFIDIIKRIVEGIYTIGDLTIARSYLDELYSNIIIFSTSLANIYEENKKIYKILGLIEKAQNEKVNEGLSLDRIEKIEFNNVTFRYPNSDKDILRNFDLLICRNKVVALVGENGGGKTTIVKLLLRFYEVNDGEIKINDINIQEYAVNSLRSKFGVFFQEAPIYDFTIEENILMNRNIERSLLQKVMSYCNIDNIIAEGKNGKDTYIHKTFDKDGLELSGGQAQKVALSRALLDEKCEVIILDEPSSMLDTISEEKLFNQLRLLAKEKILLFVSHRLSNILIADEVVMIKNGKVLAVGKHKMLLESCPEYEILYNAQADKYVK